MDSETMLRAPGESPQMHLDRLLALDLAALTAEEQAELVSQLCAAERERQAREQLLPFKSRDSGTGRARASA